MSLITIRPAVLDDLPRIVEFNLRLAAESENRELAVDVLTAGVEAVLRDPSKGRYFVACDADVPTGQLMHTWEWSDWRNGMFWWVQSVYVAREYRGRGIFRRLIEHLRSLAAAETGVVGLRLYVEHNNAPARAVYDRLGFGPTGYLVLEQGPPPAAPSGDRNHHPAGS